MSAEQLVSRFSRTWSDADLDLAVNIAPTPISFVGRDADDDAESLESGLMAFYQVTAQGRRLLRFLFGLAAAYTRANFSSEHRYIEGLYLASPWRDDTRAAVCLCGLAGVGKTQLLRAFQRLVGGTMPMKITGHSGLSLVPLWALSTEDGYGLNALLQQVLHAPRRRTDAEMESTKSRKLSMPELIKKARRQSWRDGVPLMSIDEPQFGALGDANARITGLLLQLNRIGPRLVFAANYSLMHKLCGRRQEDRQRLLGRVQLVSPHGHDSACWVAYLTSAQKVAPEILQFDPQGDAAAIQHLTFGIERLFVQLVRTAFRLAWRRDKTTVVRMEELRVAYRSLEYAGNRSDVETLHRQAISGQMLKSDLWCPLAPVDPGSADESGSNVHAAGASTENFEKVIEEMLLEDSLTRAEANAAKAMSSTESKPKKHGSLIPFRGRKTSKDDLLAGAQAWDKL